MTEPNYKALYTELKGEVLEKVGVIGRIARSNDGSRTFDDCIRDLMLIDDQCRALSTLYDKLSSIEEFPELPSGDVSTHAAGEGEDVCPDCGLDWCGATCGRWPKGSVDA